MIMARSEYQRLWHTLVVRGSLMVALGVVAMLWPEPVLVDALLAVGLLASLLGIYEASIGATLPRGTPGRTVVTLHGLVTLAFGLMTVGAPPVSLALGLAVVTGWLLLYAGVAFGAAVISKLSWLVRAMLATCGFVNVVLALMVALYPDRTIFILLFFGAAYAALFGAWQVAVGLWLRRQTHDWRRAGHHAIATA